MKQILFSLVLFTSCGILQAQSPADSTMAEYTGRYVFPEGNVVPDVTVSLDNDQLSMTSTAGSSSLSRLGVDSFSIVEFSGLAVFKRNELKKINRVYIEAAGYTMEGTREEGTGWSFIIRRRPEAVLSDR